MQPQTPNRIAVVYNGRRLFDQTGVRVEMIAQDDGETLKVFVSDLPVKEKSRAKSEHRERFVRSLRGGRR